MKKMQRTTDHTQWTRTASDIYLAQNRQIHKALSALGLPYGENKDSLAYLLGQFCGRKKAHLSALTLGQRQQLIAHFRRTVDVFNPFVPREVSGWKKGQADIELNDKSQIPNAKKRGFPGKPAGAAMKDWQRGKMLGKIEALLAEAGRPWAYAHGLAKKMFGVDRVEWCNANQLHSLVGAMMYDAKRHGRRTR